MSQSRIDWIDYSKAILIMLVVFAHCPRVPYTLDALIVGFHMPAFLSYQAICINVSQVVIIA